MSLVKPDWPNRVAALGFGEILTLIGLKAVAFKAEIQAYISVTRRMLQLDIRNAESVNDAIERILDDLADLALALWPGWLQSDDSSETNLDVLAIWRREAARVAEAGRSPRFRGVPASTELRQLLAALDPESLVLVAQIDIDNSERTAGCIAALEWCAWAGASVVILCPRHPGDAPPFDRILYGAV